MKTKVIFCTQVKQSKTGSRGYLRQLKSKNYRLDKMVEVSTWITIEGKKYVIKSLRFSSDRYGLTQEIWVVPYESK